MFSTVDPDSKSYLSQLYFQSVGCELGNASAEGGAESETEWMARGPCYTFRFAKDESNRSTECQLSLEFGTTVAWDVNSRVFIVAEYMQGTRITHAGGVITQIEQSIG